jgi:hypothetical protein
MENKKLNDNQDNGDNGENPLKRPLTIVFCLPGTTFSHHFLKSWSELLLYCITHKIRPIISSHQSSNVHFVRNMCLGADVLRGKDQHPFDGKLDYDFMMWIDSDQVFSVNSFISLLKHDKEVVSGLYLMKNGQQYTAVRNWDEANFLNKGSFEFLNRKTLMQWLDENADGEIEEKKDKTGNPYKDYSKCKIPLMPVSYTGLGWTLVKKGVFEKLSYPWFYGTKITMNKKVSIGEGDDVTENREIVDYTSEDVTFFLNLKKINITPYVEVSSIVGHEKPIVL